MTIVCATNSMARKTLSGAGDDKDCSFRMLARPATSIFLCIGATPILAAYDSHSIRSCPLWGQKATSAGVQAMSADWCASDSPLTVCEGLSCVPAPLLMDVLGPYVLSPYVLSRLYSDEPAMCRSRLCAEPLMRRAAYMPDRLCTEPRMH